MLESLWLRFLTHLEKDFQKNQPVLFSFLKQIKPVELMDNQLVLGCNNPGLKLFLEKKIDVLEEIFSRFADKKHRISFVLTNNKKQKKQKEMPLLNFQPTLSDIVARAGLSPQYRFDNFAVSSTNQVAYAAAQAVVDNLGRVYNPLFLYGGVGVGKTHLAQAVAHQILEKDPQKKILFSPGDLFTNDLIESIRQRKTSQFRKKYRFLDLLIIDDVQFIAGKQTVQEEFFHTFNSIVSRGGQIILTSDQPPNTIKNLEDRLRSRFSGGLIVDIQPPNFELRTAILLIKAQEKNIRINIGAAKIIAEKITDSRGLEGALLSIYAKILGKKEEVDEETVTDFFISEKEKKTKKISPNDVLRAVCSYYNIKISKIKGRTKDSFVVLPRQIIMYILRKYLSLKLEQVAFFINRKDHTTVIHAIKKVEKLLIKDPLFKQEINNILSSLNLST